MYKYGILEITLFKETGLHVEYYRNYSESLFIKWPQVIFGCLDDPEQQK